MFVVRLVESLDTSLNINENLYCFLKVNIFAMLSIYLLLLLFFFFSSYVYAT